MRTCAAPHLASCLFFLLLCLAGVHMQAYEPKTVLEAIDSAMDLNAFRVAATNAGYLHVLDSPDFNGTVFAPNDLVRRGPHNTQTL